MPLLGGGRRARRPFGPQKSDKPRLGRACDARRIHVDEVERFCRGCDVLSDENPNSTTFHLFFSLLNPEKAFSCGFLM